MPYLVRDYRLDSIEDATRLAAMFNDFDSAWPGGFTRGLDETPDRIRRRMNRSRRQAVLVAVEMLEGGLEGDFVGYCDLEAQVGQREVAYVDLLGARLSHHGRGVGKLLLREMVRRVTALGYRQLTLHTWPGNTKAVPLYKKTGFQWVPDTDVFMRNFLPSILNSAAGRALFEKSCVNAEGSAADVSCDWYTAMEREIKVAPDDVTWHGMKVYSYRFRKGDDTLEMIFDANGGLTSIETADYRVSCSLHAEEAPAGETLPVTWEIAAKRSRPIPVTLLVDADTGLHLRVQEQFLVEGEYRITRDLRVDSQTAPRRGGEPAHRIRTTLLLDGMPLSLETGVKVVRPFDIEYGGQAMTVGQNLRFEAILKSNLDRTLSGQIALAPHPQIECAAPVQSFTLEPRMRTQAVFTVRAREGGAFATRLRATTGETQMERPVLFRALEGAGALGSIDAEYSETAILESLSLRAETHLRGGGLSLHAPTRGAWMMWQNLAELGPPFTGHRMIEPRLKARIEPGPQDTKLILSAPSAEFPGLTVERTVSFLGDGLAKIEFRVYNHADIPQITSLRVGLHGDFDGFLTAPTPQGLIHEPLRGWGEFPSGETDLLAAGARFSETWFALEDEERLGGLIWTGDPEVEFQWSRFPQLQWNLGEIPAHSLHEVPPFYLLAGAGDWKTVRRWWHRLTQPHLPPEERLPEPVRVLEVRAEPALLLADRELVRIELINRRGLPLNGLLRLTGEEFLPSVVEIPVQAANREHHPSAEVEVCPPNRPCAGFIEATLEAGAHVERFKLPLIRAAGPGKIAVTELETGHYRVENGFLALAAAPGFFGAMVGLERDGVNQIASAWPTPRPLSWSNPWYGGVHASLWNDGEERLAYEAFAGGSIKRTGTRGLCWEGVRARCDPKHKEWRWLSLELEYLTLPGSNLVALISRWTNRQTARVQFGGGTTVWPQPGGTHANLILHWERDNERRVRRRGGFQMNGGPSPWAAAENPETGDTLLLVSASMDAYVNVRDLGPDGASLTASDPFPLEPGETKERLHWLVLLQDKAEMTAYAAALSTLRELP